jgi:hypothetical protein
MSALSVAQINGRALLPLDEAAQILGIAEKTIRNQLVRGSFPIATAKIGRRRLVVVADLLRFIGAATPTPENTPAAAAQPAPPRRPRGRPRKYAAAAPAGQEGGAA